MATELDQVRENAAIADAEAITASAERQTAVAEAEAAIAEAQAAVVVAEAEARAETAEERAQLEIAAQALAVENSVQGLENDDEEGELWREVSERMLRLESSLSEHRQMAERLLTEAQAERAAMLELVRELRQSIPPISESNRAILAREENPSSNEGGDGHAEGAGNQSEQSKRKRNRLI
jgi:hypothetical protein